MAPVEVQGQRLPQAIVYAEDERKLWTEKIQHEGRLAASKEPGERSKKEEDAITRAASVEGIYPEPYENPDEAQIEPDYEKRSRQQATMEKAIEEGRPIGLQQIGDPEAQPDVRRTVDGDIKVEKTELSQKMAKNVGKTNTNPVDEEQKRTPKDRSKPSQER